MVLKLSMKATFAHTETNMHPGLWCHSSSELEIRPPVFSHVNAVSMEEKEGVLLAWSSSEGL